MSASGVHGVAHKSPRGGEVAQRYRMRVSMVSDWEIDGLLQPSFIHSMLTIHLLTRVAPTSRHRNDMTEIPLKVMLN